MEQPTNKKYYEIRKKYLADALSWLGMRYYIFDNFLNEKVYSFENTDKFQEALSGLFALREKINTK